MNAQCLLSPYSSIIMITEWRTNAKVRQYSRYGVSMSRYFFHDRCKLIPICNSIKNWWMCFEENFSSENLWMTLMSVIGARLPEVLFESLGFAPKSSTTATRSQKKLRISISLIRGDPWICFHLFILIIGEIACGQLSVLLLGYWVWMLLFSHFHNSWWMGNRWYLHEKITQLNGSPIVWINFKEFNCSFDVSSTHYRFGRTDSRI